MKQRTVQVLSISLFVTLLVWGVYAFLSYLGAPTHLQSMLSPNAIENVGGTIVVKGSGCGADSHFCNGYSALLPFIIFLFSRMAPLLGYGLVSLILYGVYVGYYWMQRQSWLLRMRLRPWYFFALFLAGVWLFFTVLSMQSPDGIPLRRLVAPSLAVYPDASTESLQTLQDNFDELKNGGCLTPVGQTDGGADLYDIKVSCIQMSFVTRVLPQILASVALLFELLVLGRGLLRLLRLSPKSLLVEASISAGLGTFCLIGLLWLVAIIGVYIQPVGWALLLIIPVALYPQARYWFQKFLSHTWEVEVKAYSITVFLTWFLISYLAFNFLTVVRPFPIGWDDLGSYLNRPRLLVSYGHFIFGMASFQWEYITSLGFLLFGYDSYFGATTAMIMNWTAGVLAIFAVYTFARTFLGRNRGILSALLYYTLPMVGHFSFADMKIDNALFAIGALATFALFYAFFPPVSEAEQITTREKLTWIGVSGGLIGLAFGIKVTAAMLLMALGALLMGMTLNPFSFVSAALFALAVFTYKGTLDINAIGARITGGDSPLSPQAFMALCLILGAGLLLVTVWNRAKWKQFGLSLACFLGGFFLSLAPWIGYNNIVSGNVVPQLVLGLPNTLTPSIDLRGTQTGQNVRSLPADLAVDVGNPACKPSGSGEELDRYWGFDKGWQHYATLPWRSVLNLDSSGYYVMTSFALLLFPLLLLLPFFWTPQGRWLRWLAGGTTFLIIEWMFLANGIPWYGIAMFLGLSVCLEALVARAPDVPSRTTASILIALALMCVFSLRLWQWDQQKNLFEYPMGKISADALKERTIQHYDQISNLIVSRHDSMPDRPYLYRIGTFIPYFIPRNLEIIGIGDQQLDLFHCLNQENNHELTLKRINALGFNSIVFDTNTQTIESDPQGSLHQKVQEFLDFANDPKLGLQIVVNDPNAGVAFLMLP